MPETDSSSTQLQVIHIPIHSRTSTLGIWTVALFTAIIGNEINRERLSGMPDGIFAVLALAVVAFFMVIIYAALVMKCLFSPQIKIKSEKNNVRK